MLRERKKREREIKKRRERVFKYLINFVQKFVGEDENGGEECKRGQSEKRVKKEAGKGVLAEKKREGGKKKRGW